MLAKLRRKYDFSAYLFIAPAMAFFLTFVLYPMLRGIYMSLLKYRGRRVSFVGLDNYTKLLGGKLFIKCLINEFYI